MAQDVLSADELDALLAGDGTAKLREKRVADYDLARPSKLTGDQLRHLQRIHDAIAGRMADALSSYLRLEMQVAMVSLGELSFQVFRNSLPAPTGMLSLSLEPLAPRALATIDMKLAFSLIDRLLGGPGKPLGAMRPPTAIEQALLDNVMQRVLARYAEGWKDLAPFTPAVTARDTDPQAVLTVPAHEMVLVATFSISAGEVLPAADLCFCIPFIHLEPVLAKLGSPTKVAAMPRPQTAEQRGHLDGVVKQATLPLRVELGTTTLTVGEILAMRRGDVLVLDQRADAPAVGHVAGKPRLTGRPGRIGRKLALLVERVIPSSARTPERK